MNAASHGDQPLPVGDLSRELGIDLERLDDGRVCLRLAGELDLATAEPFDRTLNGALSSAETLILDLSGVTFMDSTGLASIITAVNRARDRGAVLQIASPLPAQPYRLLELTGVMERLSFTPQPPRVES